MCRALSENSFGLWWEAQRDWILLTFYLPMFGYKSSQLLKWGMMHIREHWSNQTLTKYQYRPPVLNPPVASTACPQSMLASVTENAPSTYSKPEWPHILPLEALKLLSYFYKSFEWEVLKARMLNTQQLVLRVFCVLWVQHIYYGQLQSWEDALSVLRTRPDPPKPGKMLDRCGRLPVISALKAG